VLVYDPVLAQNRPSRQGRGSGGVLSRAPAIWLSALGLGAVVGGTLAFTNPLTYSATGLLLGVGTDDTRAQDERAIIRSGEVMRGIVERLGAARLAPACVREAVRATACAAEAVKAQMDAQVVGDPNGIETGAMLRLTAIHADPVIAVGMLDAAVAIDRKIWQAAHRADRVDALVPQLAAAQSALDETAAETARIRAEARVTNIAQDLAQAAADTAAITRQDGELRLRQAAAGAELTAAQNALHTVPETVLDSREVSIGDAATQDSRTLLLQLKLQRAHLTQLYARDYPGVAELDHKIETVETAMKTQAKSTTSVTRDVRNPVLAVLATKMASLWAESAGLVQQRQELQRQLSAASSREAALRDAERRLSALRQRQGVQEATVRQLTLSMANLRAQDVLSSDHLAERRLLQRPEAVVIPWTGLRAAALIGSVTGLLAGFGLSMLAWRRRSFGRVVQASRQALERLESVWLTPTPREAPEVMAVPLPPAFGRPASRPVPPAIASKSESLANALETGASLRMFALRGGSDIRNLRFDGQPAGAQAKLADETDAL
jgi:uncharacterized protein involved in exopolysaccharide biosynthesis